MPVTDSFPTKSVADVLSYAFDFTKWATAGDPLVSATLSIDPPGDLVMQNGPNCNPPLVTFTLGAGVDGTTYTISCVGSLASGQVVQHSALLPVSEQ